eukprot:jgi/Bigna1/82931/fgenesh1_pg.99_\
MVFVMITACWLLTIPTTEASFKDHKPRRGVKRDSESRKLEIPREDKFERRERLLRERRRKENAENRLKNVRRNTRTTFQQCMRTKTPLAISVSDIPRLCSWRRSGTLRPSITGYYLTGRTGLPAKFIEFTGKIGLKFCRLPLFTPSKLLSLVGAPSRSETLPTAPHATGSACKGGESHSLLAHNEYDPQWYAVLCQELNIEMKRGSLHYAVRTYPGVQATHTIFVQPGENIKKLRREYVAWDPQTSTGVKERQSTGKDTHGKFRGRVSLIRSCSSSSSCACEMSNALCSSPDSSYKKLAGSMRKLKALSHRLVKVDTKIKLMGKPLSEKEKRKRGIAYKRLFGIKRIVAEL